MRIYEYLKNTTFRFTKEIKSGKSKNSYKLYICIIPEKESPSPSARQGKETEEGRIYIPISPLLSYYTYIYIYRRNRISASAALFLLETYPTNFSYIYTG